MKNDSQHRKDRRTKSGPVPGFVSFLQELFTEFLARCIRKYGGHLGLAGLFGAIVPL